MKPLDQLSHYEVLELEPGATPEEIDRSFARLKEVFAPGSLAAYSLVDSFDQQRMLARLEEAYQVLSDPAARSAYDERNDLAAPPRTLVPAGRLAPAEEPAPAARPDPPALPQPPRIDPATEFTGDLLRRVRESRGLTIRQVAEITRIGTGYLQAIEDEAFARLPERVYLRGFLVSYARELKLEPSRVVASYLARWEAGKGGN